MAPVFLERLYILSDTVTEKGLEVIKIAWESKGKLHVMSNQNRTFRWVSVGGCVHMCTHTRTHMRAHVYPQTHTHTHTRTLSITHPDTRTHNHTQKKTGLL